MKIDFLFIIPRRLAEIVAVFIFAYGSMKVVYDLLMLKYAMPVKPAAIFIEPEYGFIFGNYDLLRFYSHHTINIIT